MPGHSGHAGRSDNFGHAGHSDNSGCPGNFSHAGHSSHSGCPGNFSHAGHSSHSGHNSNIHPMISFAIIPSPFSSALKLPALQSDTRRYLSFIFLSLRKRFDGNTLTPRA